jgi:para-nitrobenzyl esterase
VRDADRYGAICMQKITPDNGVGPGPASEDCLTLNVFAPQRAAHLPVMVWIHGGGFVNGSATAPLYDGSALARQGVVVVTVNYRLGRFGFFAHPALTAEQRGGLLANYGLMDQIAALRWVKRNIGAFGGDPANVTIFGESAGGMAVNRLMMIDEARGLFAKAIVESGAGRERGQTLRQAEDDGAAFATKLGTAHADAAALRALPADRIVAAGDLDVIVGEAPILDGKLLREDPADAFAAGRVARVPYLIGSNSLEFPAIWSGAMRAKLVMIMCSAT